MYVGEFIGFTNLGDVNQEIAAIATSNKDLPVATHVLTFMIRGIFNNKEFTVAHYPTSGLSGEKLYSIVWSVIKALEVTNFKVRK